ncbi:MAG: MFS transporter [Bacilli bacterium]|nr:MFS transporter [Bacilli bacterium]
MNKEIKRIFIVLSLFAFADGFFYNFQQLWLLENNLSVQTIGTILSLGALLSVSTIFLCSNLIKQSKLKNFVVFLLLIKALTMIALFCLNSSGLNIIIKFLIMLDYVLDVEIYVSLYPLICLVTQDDKIYAKRGIYYSAFYYISVLLTGFLLGKNILQLYFNYNLYIIISAIFIFLGLFILLQTDCEKYCNEKNEIKNNENIIFALIKKIKNDSISKNFLLFIFFGDICYYSISSLLMIMLTQHIGFDPTFSSNFMLILGIISVIIANLVLEKFTFKNNYINISIKFIGRLVTYVIAALFCSKGAYLLAVIYVKLSAESYSHVTHAPYINRFKGDYQFAFSNLNEIISYLSRAIGTILCSILITINVRYVFIAASIFSVLLIFYAFRALKLRNEESVLINDK